jgi:hypothetical protein
MVRQYIPEKEPGAAETGSALDSGAVSGYIWQAMSNPFFDRLKLRSKLLLLVLPLVIIPIIVVALVTGFIANQKAYLGITQPSKDDLQHMAEFTIDLLRAYDKQFQD